MSKLNLGCVFSIMICSIMTSHAIAEQIKETEVSTSDLIIATDVKHDVSLPLRDLRARTDLFSPRYMTKSINKVIAEKIATANLSSSLKAPLIPLIAFQGIGMGLGNYQVTQPQPDSSGGAGFTQYIQFANPDIGVFDKVTGQIAAGFPKPASSLWAGFGGTCENFASGRITVKIDLRANRWVISQFANENSFDGPFYHCVAISTTEDATGSYNRYAFQLDSFSDYTRLGIWSDAYYLGLNMIGRISFGPRMCAMDREKMLAGQTANIICKQLTNQESQPLMPANALGATILLPPAGSPEYFIGLSPPYNLHIYKFYVDFAQPHLTRIASVLVPVNPFKQVCQDTDGVACAVQPDTTNRLNVVSNRVMTRVVYRRFSEGYGAMVATHVIEGPQPKFAPAVRWYELRIPDNTSTFNPIVYQQATLAPDSKNRYNPSINMDALGNIVIGYTVSSTKVHPSPEMGWRTKGDPLNRLNIQPLVTGLGSQIDGITNWGSESKLVTDPVNNCTMWYTSPYLKQDGSFNWSTAIIKMNLPNCV